MATTPLSDILNKAISSKSVSLNSNNSKDWFRNKATSISNADPATFISKSKAQESKSAAIGQMYLFNYDPKLKNDLPYYDRYPLIFPFAEADNGFLGLNMHYLPPTYRGKLMDALYTIVTNDKNNNATGLQMSYQILNNASRFRYFKPCVKHYLNSHVKSRFLWVPADQWKTALFLPLERFAKASTATVWQQSRGSVK